MATTDLAPTAWKLGNPTKILLTPYNGSVIGTTTYQLDDVVGDSFAITQEDNTTNTVEGETKSEAIFEIIKLGKYTVAFESGDIQKDFVVNAMGFTYDSTNKILYAPKNYKEVWAKIEIVFGDLGSLVCPKVKINGKIDASSLQSNIVRGIISGTCYDGALPSGTETSSFYMTEPSAS